MTSCWAYGAPLGAGDALDWGGDWNGNIPRSNLLPDLDRDAYSQIVRLAAAGRHGGRQVDWGAWAIRVTGPELRSFILDLYGARPAPPEAAELYLRHADSMRDGEVIALVACEL
ncbi:MAG: hypothetical protein JWO25_1272 [Alphaproteobacteria bacterium]|nr:hypothetical protein [Alphaproteobacteria bacterium]